MFSLILQLNRTTDNNKRKLLEFNSELIVEYSTADTTRVRLDYVTI